MARAAHFPKVIGLYDSAIILKPTQGYMNCCTFDEIDRAGGISHENKQEIKKPVFVLGVKLI